MKILALILVLWTSPFTFALDDMDVDGEGPDTGSSGLVQSSDLLRTIASGTNYFVNVTKHSGDFHIQNLGFGNSAMRLVVISPEGAHSTKFIKLAPGQIRAIPSDVLEGGSEFYLISLQNFKVHLGEPVRSLFRSSSTIPAVAPRNPLPLVRVIAPNGAEVTVGVDADDNVHYIVFGNIIGKWDHKQQAAVQSNGTVLPKQD